MEQVDGIDLRQYFPGRHYEVGNALGALFLSEGWAEPTDSTAPAAASAVPDVVNGAPLTNTPTNLIREFFPPHCDAPPARAMDRRRRRGR